MNEFGGKSYPYEGEITQDDKTWAIIAHVSPVVLGFLGPLIVWLVKKEQSEFIRKAALEALVFQIGVFIGAILLGIIAAITCGFGAVLFLPYIIYIIGMAILGAIRANEGKVFEYPLTSQFVK